MSAEWVFSKGHQTNIQQSYHVDHLGNNNKKMNLFIEGSPISALALFYLRTSCCNTDSLLYEDGVFD